MQPITCIHLHQDILTNIKYIQLVHFFSLKSLGLYGLGFKCKILNLYLTDQIHVKAQNYLVIQFTKFAQESIKPICE